MIKDKLSHDLIHAVNKNLKTKKMCEIVNDEIINKFKQRMLSNND